MYDDIALKDAKALFHFLQRRGFVSESSSAALDYNNNDDDTTDITTIAKTIDNTRTCTRTVVAALPPLPPLLRDASPLTGVDMVEATCGGIVAWRVRKGAIVKEGELLGEIINMEDPDASRVPITAKVSGVVFSMSRHKLVRPGQVVIKVAGKEPLSWRIGNLLTSK